MSMKVMLSLRCVVLARRMVVFPSFDVCPFNLYLGSVVYITGDKLLAVKAEARRKREEDFLKKYVQARYTYTELLNRSTKS